MLYGLPQPLFADLGAAPPPLVFIDDQTAANVAQIDIAWDLEFEQVHVLLNDVAPISSNAQLYARTSSDGGATFDSGATDYRAISTVFDGGAAGLASSGTDKLYLSDDANALSTTADAAYLVTVRRPFDTGLFTAVHNFGGYFSPVLGIGTTRGFGQRNVAGRVNALRFYMSTGNIDVGRFFAWGELP